VTNKGHQRRDRIVARKVFSKRQAGASVFQIQRGKPVGKGKGGAQLITGRKGWGRRSGSKEMPGEFWAETRKNQDH